MLERSDVAGCSLDVCNTHRELRVSRRLPISFRAAALTQHRQYRTGVMAQAATINVATESTHNGPPPQAVAKVAVFSASRYVRTFLPILEVCLASMAITVRQNTLY